MKFETISANKIEECIANKDMIIIDIRNPMNIIRAYSNIN